MFYVNLRTICILLLLDDVFYKWQLDPILVHLCPSWYFCLLDLSITDKSIEVSTIIVDSSIFPCSSISFCLTLFFLTFIHFWETDGVWAGKGQRERERQNPKQAPGSELSAQPDAGLELTNREIMTRAEVGRSTDGATQVPLSCMGLITLMVLGSGLNVKKSHC